ncbi:hypothetical protein VPH35_069323 [Triticum aestivum]
MVGPTRPRPYPSPAASYPSNANEEEDPSNTKFPASPHTTHGKGPVVPAGKQPSRPTPPMAASLRSPPPVPAASAFRRCRAAAVVCASSSSSSSSSAVSSAPKARFVARRSESTSVQQLARPLAEYMGLPASQYSVLDAERIERVDESTFRCYVYRFRFFALEVCPVLLVRVDEEPNGCCIRLLSCKLEGSPLVEAQNDKFSGEVVRLFMSVSSSIVGPDTWHIA